MASFLDVNSIQKFVLKLVIPATDDTPEQIRRVKVPRIADDEGYVSYEELVGLVLTLQPSVDDDNENEDMDNDGQMSVASMTSARSIIKKVVQFDYQDADGDKVTIASTEELVDALEQFRDQGTLRIATRIVTTIKTPTPSVTRYGGVGAAGAGSVRSMGTTSSTIQTNRTASNPAAAAAPHNSSNNRSNNRSNSSASSMVNTIVGALANVVVSLEEGMNQHHHQQAFVAQVPKSEPNKDEEKPGAAQVETTSSDMMKEEEANAKEDQGTDATSPPPSGPPPFIHGRHTCDSCIVSPIVGKRYHATNLPDYDVCEVCFENYQGEDIKFEPVEHERDVAFQERWNRKRERFEAHANMVRHGRARCGGGGRRGGPGGGRRGGGGRGGGGGPGGCRGPRWHHHHGQSPVGVPTPFGPPPHGHTHSPAPPSSFSDFDHALTEAIRRSLEDVGPKQEDEVMADSVELKATPVPEPPIAPMEEEIVVPPSAPAVIQTSAPINAEPKLNLKPAPVVEDYVKPAPVVSNVAVVTEAMGALDMVADVIDEMMQDTYAKFQDAALEAKPDTVESNPNEWQIVAENADDDSVIQQTVWIVTEEQRQRWFAQLSQLREIGFYDEGQCVETLERLHAANIGSDVSDEEISVTRVVNEILKQQK